MRQNDVNVDTLYPLALSSNHWPEYMSPLACRNLHQARQIWSSGSCQIVHSSTSDRFHLWKATNTHTDDICLGWVGIGGVIILHVVGLRSNSLVKTWCLIELATVVNELRTYSNVMPCLVRKWILIVNIMNVVKVGNWKNERFLA